LCSRTFTLLRCFCGLPPLLYRVRVGFGLLTLLSVQGFSRCASSIVFGFEHFIVVS
jgi:hypothetical protein